jgi:hypothetical protein
MGFVSQIWSDRVVLEESQDNLSKDGKSFDEIVVWLENIQIFFPELKYLKCSFENKHKNIRKEISDKLFSMGVPGEPRTCFSFTISTQENGNMNFSFLYYNETNMKMRFWTSTIKENSFVINSVPVKWTFLS